MKKQNRRHRLTRAAALAAAAGLVVGAAGCSSESRSLLNPDHPVTVTVWNYYNSDQLAAFEALVNEFNDTVGLEQGIIVVSVSQGSIDNLADALLDSAQEKAGADDLPSMAAVYAETAYILDQAQLLTALDDYFTEEELGAYIPSFLAEGHLTDDGPLMLFPVSKSTEVFAANVTDWASFADATGFTLEQIQTKEDLTAAAQAYYQWTDSITPDIPEDGLSLYGRDSIANYIYLGAKQLGHPLFTVSDGTVYADLDRDTFKTLWDNYYIPYINGYFGAYANYRSEDTKTGSILALTCSSSGVGFLPSSVTLPDDTSHDIEMKVFAPLPFRDAAENSAIQQGAGYCILQTTAAEQYASAEFLKWFTQPEHNLSFSLLSGYAPVTAEANDPDTLRAAYESSTDTFSQIKADTLTISSQLFLSGNTYASKPFAGSKDLRSLLNRCMSDAAIEDRHAVVAAMEAGATREEAVAPYITEEYFDAWFDGLCQQVNALLPQE